MGVFKVILNFILSIFKSSQESVTAAPVVVVSSTEESIMPQNFAVLVGINKYVALSGSDLNGCVNDVNDIYDRLTKNYGFEEDNIRVLCDERATQQNILERLEWLISSAQPGSQLVFQYSGHGSSIRCRNEDTLENEECQILCPTDMDWDNPLTDKILAGFFRRIPEGAFLTFLCDACLAGATKIPLLDGTEKTIAEMEKDGGEYWVYSSLEDGRVVPGRAHSARITGTRKLIRVVLDNGESVECTDDHRFMMRDGSFVEAGDLVEGDSLMPLYRREWRSTDSSYLKGYEFVQTTNQENGKRRWCPTHIAMRDAVGMDMSEGKSVCHHSNFNKRDNRPENLKMMTWYDHKRIHGEVGRKNFKKVWSDPDYRAWRSSEEYCRLQSELVRECWKDEEYRRIHVEAAQNRDNSENSKRFIEMNKSEEGRERSRNVSKANWENQELREKMSASSKEYASSPEGVLKTRKTNHVRWHEKRGLVKEDCEFCCPNNHKVVRVEDTGRTEVVYDLTVDEFHNFALSSGVFVHNCHSGSMDRAMPIGNPHPVKVRYLKPPFDIAVRSRNRNLPVNRVGWKDLFGPRSASNIAFFKTRHLLLSGCRDNQTSADALLVVNTMVQ